jgi:glycosyltransferase involved in cell wall biosynthesis
VSAYDHARLQKTLNSFPFVSDFLEILIVTPENDASTQKIVLEFKQKHSINTSTILDQNDGIYPAMNLGAEASIGKYIVFINSGDLWVEPNASFYRDLATSLHKWEICTPIIEWRNVPINNSTNLKNFLLSQENAFVSHQAVLFSRNLFLELGGYPVWMAVAADTALIYFCAQVAKPNYNAQKIVWVEKPNYAATHIRRSRIEFCIFVFLKYNLRDKFMTIRNVLLNGVRDRQISKLENTKC